MNNREFGAAGEERTARYLQNKGFTILERNFKTRFGEIDIICRDSKFICFVEVKTRKSNRFAEAREFVDYHKQQRIKTTALFWLRSHPSNLQPRFDVSEVYSSDEFVSDFHIELIEDAF